MKEKETLELITKIAERIGRINLLSQYLISKFNLKIEKGQGDDLENMITSENKDYCEGVLNGLMIGLYEILEAVRDVGRHKFIMDEIEISTNKLFKRLTGEINEKK